MKKQLTKVKVSHGTGESSGRKFKTTRKTIEEGSLTEQGASVNFGACVWCGFAPSCVQKQGSEETRLPQERAWRLLKTIPNMCIWFRELAHLAPSVM